jgi:hypothetical protein
MTADTSADIRERPHLIRAQLYALLGAGPTADRLDALHLAAQHMLGAAHETTLTVEYHLRVHRAAALPAEDALAIAADLWDRVRVTLPPNHSTHRAITSHLVGCLIRRGRPGDLNLAVAHRCEQVQRHGHGPGADGLGTAHLHLAAVLVERARFGWLDPEVTPAAANDAEAAGELIRSEVDRRSRAHGPGHPSTWQARAVRCELLLARARDAAGGRAAEALALADALIGYEWEHARGHTVGALRAQLWRAEALLLLGRGREAEGDARLASFLASRYPDPNVSDALLVLARALAQRDRRAARSAAELALNARLRWSVPDGYHVAEARLLVDRLRRVDGHLVRAIGAPVPPPRRCRTHARRG